MHDKPTFYEQAEQLDSFISLQAPTQKQIKEVIELVADKALERYFFKHLADSENPAWFEPLRQRGFFSTPPEPVEHGGTASHPQWPALWYVVAVAPKLSGAVVEVAGQIRSQNMLVFWNLVRAAQKMPLAQSARMVPLIVRWTDEGMRVEQDVVSLAVYLARGGQWESALILVELILSPKKAQGYFVQRFVERDLAFFLEQQPLKMLDIVQRNLEQALEIEGQGEDASSIGWRPAIEPHEQNWGFGETKDLLVDAAVQTLAHLVKTMPAQGRTKVETYLRHPRSIFRRLAIHSIRVNATLWPDLVEALFVDERYLDDEENYHVYHEYWMLMNEAYGTLPVPIQDNFVERLLKKLPSEQVENQMLYHARRRWVLNRMWAIKDFLRSDEHRGMLAELVGAYGEPDHPSFLSYSSSLVGTTSPKTSEELTNLSSEEIHAELQKELPFEDFDKPSQEGLADVLKAAVVKAPGRFAPMAPKLFGPEIPPIYTYHALGGFREAWKESEFGWEPVLELCDMVSQTREQDSDSGEPLDMKPGYWMTTYASARSAVADLLEAGVIRDEKAIPSELLPRVRDILLVLADDPNPSPQYEQERIAERVPYDVLTIALNVTRGKAIEALLHYALHVARTSSQEQSPEPRSRMEDKVRDKLTEKLDKRVDPSLAVHSLFGKYLPNLHYLDKEWLSSNLECIFLRLPEMANYWEAAWDGYMFRGDFFGRLYEEMLKPYYRYALEQVALGEQGKAGSALSRGRLAQHLAALYWRGVETLEGDDSLVVLFFSSAPDELRAAFIRGLEAALREAKPDANSAEWLRARTLWETRYHTIEKEIVEPGRLPTKYDKECSAFVGWVPFIPEALENFYPMIRIAALVSGEGEVNELIEFLSSVAMNHAPFAVSLLEELLKQSNRGSWFLGAAHTASHVRSILEAAMKSHDDQTRSCAVRVVNLFGERGDEYYRDLLNLA